MNFEQNHNFYSVENKSNNGNTSIDGKHNAECLEKMVKSVDKALGSIQTKEKNIKED